MLKEFDVVCISRRLEESVLDIPRDDSAPVGCRVVGRHEHAFMLVDGSAVPRQVYTQCSEDSPKVEGVFVARVEVDVRKSGIWQIGFIRWVPLVDVSGVFFNMEAAKEAAGG